MVCQHAVPGPVSNLQSLNKSIMYLLTNGIDITSLILSYTLNSYFDPDIDQLAKGKSINNLEIWWLLWKTSILLNNGK